MAPAAKRRKTNPVRYVCYGCGSERIGSQFPDSLPNSKCDHLINICLECFKKYVDGVMTTTLFVGKIRCPQCEEMMGQEDMERLADEGAIKKTTLAKITELNRRKVAEQNPNWRWCLNVACKSGQEHDPEVKTEEDKKPSLFSFICKSCGHHACTNCNKAWHPDETCEQFEKRTGGKHATEEAASLKKIQKITKPCPNPMCRLPTEKNGGCAHMACSQCGRSWCWKCGGIISGGLCSCGKGPAHAYF